MSTALISKVLGFVLAGVCAVSWWFIQMQVSTNVHTDARIDTLESHILMDEDHITSLQRQLQALRRQVEAHK